MKKLEYQVKFLTPAFLGNAEQSAQWRTPPFKALLRQWWRVAYAAEKKFAVRVDEMRREEGLLFGHAWLENDTFERDGRKVTTAARKSRVRIRLESPGNGNVDAWGKGTQSGVAPLPTGLATSYAWFGLVRRGDGLPDRMAIKINKGEAIRSLHIAVPKELEQKFVEVMRLIGAFGLVGSRSRGGWGALYIEGIEQLSMKEMERYARPIDRCLEDDWAASLAMDDGGLCVWQSQSVFKSWDQAMKAVAIERKQVRSALKVDVDLRPALGFAAPGRMPSPLRWKVIPIQDGDLAIRVFAMPHRLPDDSGMSVGKEQLQRAWKIVCDTLDRSPSFSPRNGR